MSYDIWLEIDTGGPEPARIDGPSHNYTSNCSPMWRTAGADLADFHGKPAAECTQALAIACEAMRLYPDEFRAMNPQNGWGDYDTCLQFLRALLADFRANPKATVVVSR